MKRKHGRLNFFARVSPPRATLSITLALGIFSQVNGASLYWDTNGDTAGAGVTPTGTWGTDTFWNTTAAGDTTLPGAWTDGETAVFSAGDDAAGDYTVTVAGDQTVAGIIQEEAAPTLSGSGSIILGAAETPIRVAGSLNIATSIGGGSNGINLSGPGVLAISGPTSFTGGLRTNGGTLKLASTMTNLGPLTFSWNNTAATQNLEILPGADVSTSRLVMCDWYYTENTVSHSGGTLTVTGNNDSNGTGASLLLGHWGYGTTCNYNLSGGTLNAPNARLSLGWDRPNVQFNQSGGTANLLGINLDNGRGNAASYKLTGGRLNIGTGGINNQANKTVEVGNATLGAFANWTSTKPLVLTGDVLVDTLDSANFTSARNIDLAANISETVVSGLTKDGLGTLSLSGSSKSYTGDTVVKGGHLLPGAALTNSVVIVNPAGSLGGGTLNTPGTSVLNDLKLNGGKLLMRAGASSDLVDAGNVSVSAASEISLIPTGQLFVGDEFVVLKYVSLTDLGFAGLSSSPLPNPHYSTSLIDDSTNSQVIVKVAAADALVWTGAGGSAWDVNTTPNWKLTSALPGTTPSNFYDFDVVTFDDTAASGIVELSGAILPASVTVDNDTLDYVFFGSPLGGPASLTKSGSKTLDLSGSNEFTGAVDIQDGRVITSTASSLGLGSTKVKLGAGTTLETTGSYTLNRGIQLTGGTASIATGPGATLSLTSPFTGTALAKTGSGTLSLSGYGGGANGFGGLAFGVLEGTLRADGGAFNADIGMASITVFPGATLSITPGHYHALGGAWTHSPVINLDGGKFTIGQEQYLGPINMTEGEILADGGNPEIRTDYNFNLHTLASDFPSTVGSGVVFNRVVTDILITTEDGGAAGDLMFHGKFSFGEPGKLIKQGPGTMVIASNQDYTAPTEINDGELRVGDSGTMGTLGTGAVTNNAKLSFYRSDSIMVPNTISGSGSLHQAFSGTTTLTGTNTYTGDTVVSAGVLAVDGDSLADAGTVVMDGGVLDLTNTESVKALKFGSTPQAEGTWGATGSGATHIDDTRFSGPGVLFVGGYYAWISDPAFGLALGDQGPDDDPDSDGVSNLLEYALKGRVPHVSDGPAGSFDPANGELVFTKRPGAVGLTYRIQESDDLGLVDTWTEVPSYLQNDAVAISFDLLPADRAKRFVRLQVDQL